MKSIASLIHSLRMGDAIGTRTGVPAWVALPTTDEETDPSFSHHAGGDLPHWNEKGVEGRLIAGSAYGGRYADAKFVAFAEDLRRLQTFAVTVGTEEDVLASDAKLRIAAP